MDAAVPTSYVEAGDLLFLVKIRTPGLGVERRLGEAPLAHELVEPRPRQGYHPGHLTDADGDLRPGVLLDSHLTKLRYESDTL